MQVQGAPGAATSQPPGSVALPPSAAEQLRRGALDLVNSGQTVRALHAGRPAPMFQLPDVNGKPVKLASLLGEGTVVLLFVEGTWNPFVIHELRAFDHARERFAALGATLIVVTMQSVDQNREAADANAFGLPILSDVRGRVTNSFGLRHAVPSDTQQIYREQFPDVSDGYDLRRLAIPARYVIARDGNIAYAEIDPDITRRCAPEILTPVLSSLATARSSRRHGGWSIA